MVAYYVLQIAVIGLLVHSLYFRPFRTNALFALFVYPVAAIYDKSTYRFSAFGMNQSIGNWPIMNFLGFLFTFYVALALCVSVLGRFYGKRIPMVPLGAAVVIFIGIFGMMMEYLNEYMHWWSFVREANPAEYFILWHWRPLLCIPPFLALLLSDRRTRRIVFALIIGCASTYLAAMVAINSVWNRHPPVEVALSVQVVFWFILPVVAHMGHRLQIWNLSIERNNLVYERPISLGRRNGADTS